MKKGGAAKKGAFYRALLPVVIVVLLLGCLAGTYAWYSQFENVGTGVEVTVDGYNEVMLSQGALGDIEPYNGQLGYDEHGVAYTGADAPYEVRFSVSFVALANRHLLVDASYKYVEIKVGQIYYHTLEETVKLVFRDTVSDPTDYLGVRTEKPYDPESADNYYVQDADGNYVRKTGSFNAVDYVAQDPQANADKDGMVILDSSGAVRYIVLKSEAAWKYFNLRYAYVAPDASGAEVIGNWQALTSAQYADTARYPLGAYLRVGEAMRLRYDASAEVATDPKKCKLHKIAILIGYYGDEGGTDTYSTFRFGGKVFTGSTFSFALRLHAESDRDAAA